MSTGKINKMIFPDDAGERFSQIAASGERLFHTQDLAVLWGITNKNTLYTTLTRYVARGLMYRIYKGLFSLVPVDTLDPLLLGLKALHRYSYISTETVLSGAGVIMQIIPSVTYVSSCSRRFSIGGHSFIVRKAADRFLYNPIGIEEVNTIPTACPERACADLLYFNPRAYFDAPKNINWNLVHDIQRALGYPMNSTKHL